MARLAIWRRLAMGQPRVAGELRNYALGGVARWSALLYAGSDLYCDDDELQDARATPFIDFKRDSVADIRCAMVERNERKEQR